MRRLAFGLARAPMFWPSSTVPGADGVKTTAGGRVAVRPRQGSKRRSRRIGGVYPSQGQWHQARVRVSGLGRDFLELFPARTRRCAVGADGAATGSDPLGLRVIELKVPADRIDVRTAAIEGPTESLGLARRGLHRALCGCERSLCNLRVCIGCYVDPAQYIFVLRLLLTQPLGGCNVRP